MDEEQFTRMLGHIKTIVDGVKSDAQYSRLEGKFSKDIKDQVKGIKACDGLIADEVREWIDSVGLAIQVLGETNHEAARKVVTQTTSGSLRKEIERFLLQRKDMVTTWPHVMDHVRRYFLSPNEEDKLKVDKEKYKQPQHESVPIFNRKYRELALKAYPEPRDRDINRILIRAYSRALCNSDLAKRLMIDGHPETLEGALIYTEEQASGIELYDSLGRQEEAMEVNVVGEATNQLTGALKSFTDAVKDMRKAQDQIMTRVAKLEINNGNSASGPRRGEATGQRRPTWTSDGKPICNYCKKIGHKVRECYQRKRDQGDQNPGPNQGN